MHGDILLFELPNLPGGARPEDGRKVLDILNIVPGGAPTLLMKERISTFLPLIRERYNL